MYFIEQPSTPSPLRSWPGSASRLRCGGGNWLGRRIAEGQKDLFGFLRVALAQFCKGLKEGFKSEIPFPFGALHAVEKRRQINEFAAGIHEIQIENLLACHNFC